MSTSTDSTPKRKCSTCGSEFPYTSEYFEKKKRNSSGLGTRCHTCNRQRGKRYAQTEQGRRTSRERKRREYAQNPQKFIERVKAYQAEHAEEQKVHKKKRKAKRRALELNAEGCFTAQDLELQYQSQKGLCWWCGKALNDEYHADHLIPLDRGGTNWPNNIVCSCQHCNCSRQNKLPHEWNGRLF